MVVAAAAVVVVVVLLVWQLLYEKYCVLVSANRPSIRSEKYNIYGW